MSQPDCDEFFALLSDYLDGELPPSRCAEFEKHLEDCPPCIVFVRSLKQSIRISRGLGETTNLPQPRPEQLAELRHAYESSIRRRSGS